MQILFPLGNISSGIEEIPKEKAIMSQTEAKWMRTWAVFFKGIAGNHPQQIIPEAHFKVSPK